MTTRPQLPPDEAPLDAASVDRVLSNVGPEMVLVGGQALAFWLDRFGIDVGDAVVSNDGDLLGDVVQARDLAQALGSRCLEPPKAARTSLVAQLRLPAADGQERNIDVLHLLYTVSGLKKSAEFTRRALANSVEVEWRRGRTIRVMDPFDVLESRVQNAAGLLQDKGPHVLTQAQWAIKVAEVALMRLASKEPGVKGRLGQRLQDLYTLAHSRPGRALLKDHGIEVLAAVDIDGLLRIAPAHATQLDKIKAALDKRHPG